MNTYFQRIGILDQALIGGGGGPASSFRSTSFISVVENANYQADSTAGEVTTTDAAGNVYHGHVSRPTGEMDIGLTKYNADGTVAWRYYYAHIDGVTAPQAGLNNMLADIKVDANGDIFAVAIESGTAGPGQGSSGDPGQIRVTLLKFNPLGDILWQRTIRDEPNAVEFMFGSMTVDSSGNAIIMFSGRLTSLQAPFNYGFNDTPQNTSKNIYIAKYSPTGTILWERGYVPTNNNNGNLQPKGDIITDAAGNVYAQYINWTQAGLVNTLKLSPSGTLLWDVYRVAWDDSGQLTAVFNGASEIPGMAISADGSTLIQGYSFAGVFDEPALLIKVDTSDGSLIANHQILLPGSADIVPLIFDVKIDPATDLIYIFCAVAVSTVWRWRPALIVTDLNYNVQFFHEFRATPLEWGATLAEFDNLSYYFARGPRMAIGPDNISISWIHDDDVGFVSVVVKYDKEGTSLTEGPLITTGRGDVWSLVISPDPVISAFTPLISDVWVAFASPAGTQPVYDISNILEVSETGIQTYGGKQAMVVNAPQIEILYTAPPIVPEEFISYTAGIPSAYDFTMVGDATATDADGNIYVGSLAGQVGMEDMMLTKYSPDGTLTWRYSYPHIDGVGPAADPFVNRFADIKCDANGDILACYTDGGTSFFDASQARLTLIKFNRDGDILWQKTIRDAPGATRFYFGSMTVDSSGNAIVMFAGRLADFVANFNYGFDDNIDVDAYNAYIAKYSPTGTLIWEKAYAGLNDTRTRYEMKADIITDATGNVYAQWISASGQNLVMIKLSPSGVLQWDNYYSAWGRDGFTNQVAGEMPYMTGFAEVPGLAVSSDGSTLIRGYAFSGSSSSPGVAAILIKVNTTTGALVANRQIIHPDGFPAPGRFVHSIINDVKIDPETDLVYVFGGVDENTGSLTDGTSYLMCMDLNFNIQWYHEYPLVPNGIVTISTYYGQDTDAMRTPRMSIGPDNVTIAYTYEDSDTVHGMLISVDKTGSRGATPNIYTTPTPVTFSITTAGTPTLIDFDPLTDGWFEIYANFNYQGKVVDISPHILVSETGVTTFGPKAAVSPALSLPIITVI